MRRMLAASAGDESMVASDDFMAQPKAEAGAVLFFGGVKGLKKALSCLSGHAYAGVGDGDGDALGFGGPMRCSADAHKEATPAFAHGVHGVADKIAKYLAYLAFQADDRIVGSVSSLNMETPGVELHGVHIQDRRDDIYGANGAGLGGLLIEA